MPSTSDYEDMRYEIIQSFSVALGICRCRDRGDNNVIALVRSAFNIAKKYGWNWEKDAEFASYKLKATEQEILVEGLRLALQTCKPQNVLPMIPTEVSPAEFAEYLWTMHCILVGDKPGTEPGRRSSGGPDADMLETFASFMSCAADDGLWVLEKDGTMGNDQDTPFGLMSGVREHVRRARGL